MIEEHLNIDVLNKIPMRTTLTEVIKSFFYPDMRKIIKNPINIGSISSPSEDLQCLAVRLDEHAIDMISNPCERAKIHVLLQNPYHIKFIANPSEKLQVLAITKNPDTIRLIENPCLKAKFACILSKPENIKYIQDPDKEIQITVIHKNPQLISELKNPCDAAQLTAILHSPDTIFTIHDPSPRACLVAIEKIAKTRIFPSNENMNKISGIISQCHKLKQMDLDYKELLKNEIIKLSLNESL